MATSKPVISEASKPYQPHGAAKTLFYCHEPEILMDGPAGTGKSIAALNKVHLCMMKYPNSRGLLVRKTRESMTQSTLVSLESKVIQTGFLNIEGGPQRSHRQSYMYPNGSELVVGGMDKPSKILSTEWDIIFCDESTELTETDHETLISRLRNGKMPYGQIICCCNPDSPFHWLNQRASNGKMVRLISRHDDNPSITQEYLDMLNRLTGVRRLRLLEGKWCSASGLVYDEFDPNIHVVKLNVKKEFFTNGFVGAVDFGYTHPGCFGVFGLDNDKRAYLVYELKYTGKTLDWWTSKISTACKLYGINRIACDSAEPGYIDAFKKAHIPAIAANKSVMQGINAVKDRLKLAGDGKPRLFILDDAITESDPNLVNSRKPLNVQQEMESYVWSQSKEAPVKEDDDSLDMLRYGVMCIDTQQQDRLVVASIHSRTEETEEPSSDVAKV